jgi:putative ABC transport system substrate-binding protein
LKAIGKIAEKAEYPIQCYGGHGAKPGDLPIEQPTKFYLVNLTTARLLASNLKTAKVLGVKISYNLLSLVNEVIE